MPLKIIQRSLLVFRYLLTTFGAFALLYAFSFAYNIIPPSVEWDYVEELPPEMITRGLQAMAAALVAPLNLVMPWVKIPVAAEPTPEAFIPWLWVAPWLFMEFFSCLGTKRNLVWFSALGTVLLAVAIAWPVLKANCPEYLSPVMPGDDGKLTDGMIKFGIFLFLSFLLRKIILDFLFREKLQPIEDDVNYADADVLDPANARTVKEIQANPTIARPTFLYGEPDEGLIARFYAMMLRLARRRLYSILLIILGVVLLTGWFFLYPQPTEEEALQRDMARMYDRSGFTDPDGHWYATPEALHSAYRVFTRMAEEDPSPLLGKQDEDADKMLRLGKADPAYVRQMRSGDIVSNPKKLSMPDKDDRYLTLSDGKHVVSLIIRHFDDGISSVERQYAGWNPRVEYENWRKWRTNRTSRKH